MRKQELKDGDNWFRFLTQPYQYIIHPKYKPINNPFNLELKCAYIGSCEICDKGEKPIPNWLIGVLDLETKEVNIININYSIFTQIRDLVRNPVSWGDPTTYDLNIIKDGGKYNVVPRKSISEINVEQFMLTEFLEELTNPVKELDVFKRSSPDEDR